MRLSKIFCIFISTLYAHLFVEVFAFSQPKSLRLRFDGGKAASKEAHGLSFSLAKNVCSRRKHALSTCMLVDLSSPLAIAAHSMQGLSGIFKISPIQIDALTGMLLYVLGKITADRINQEKTNKKEIRRWGTVGGIDGCLAHVWYIITDHLASICIFQQKIWIVLVQVFLTELLYTPLFVSIFLLVSARFDGKSLQESLGKVRTGLVPMWRMSTKTWIPINIFIFSLIPVERRVLVSMFLNYGFVVTLALWDTGWFTKAWNWWKKNQDQFITSYALSEDPPATSRTETEGGASGDISRYHSNKPFTPGDRSMMVTKSMVASENAELMRNLP
uniref:Uncharacterized protein n=1 Tax=Guillardia theta TaxID=55529 RepID=A0A6U5WUL8_GUITH|mmetsp:Transcript_15433/g.51785  ORF Transcript_15433/g.51785 Transcript_15433/m.51785 type:complete len:331 (+) Transcript_15433:206-1198(+)